jgi:4-hydroxy-tetrahydrodipicolinate synthase
MRSRFSPEGSTAVAPFGTTGEGQSFSLAERREGVDALLAAGIPGKKIAAATGCAALPETIALYPSRRRGGMRGVPRAAPLLLEGSPATKGCLPGTRK